MELLSNLRELVRFLKVKRTIWSRPVKECDKKGRAVEVQQDDGKWDKATLERDVAEEEDTPRPSSPIPTHTSHGCNSGAELLPCATERSL